MPVRELLLFVGALTVGVAGIAVGARLGVRGEKDRTPPAADGSLIWADKFRGPAGAKPDPRKWRFETGFG